MKTSAQIIKDQVNSIFVKGLIERKGWTKQQAADYVLQFVTCGASLSFFDFMSAK